MENNLEQAMLLAWRKGREDARAGKQPRSDALLAVLPTTDEADAYRAAYQQERRRLLKATLDSHSVK